MDAINRAKRRFFMRPAYVARRLGDVLKLATTKPAIVGQILGRAVFGARVVSTRPSTVARDDRDMRGAAV